MILGIIFGIAVLALLGSYVMFYLRASPPASIAESTFLNSSTYLWITGILNLAAVIVIAPVMFYFGGRAKIASMAF